MKRSAWKAGWLACVAAVGMLTLVGCVPPPASPEAPRNRPVAEQVVEKAPTQSATRTELEVRIKELELRERELALKERELARDKDLASSQQRVNDLRAKQIQRQEAERKAQRAVETIDGAARFLDIFAQGVNNTLR